MSYEYKFLDAGETHTSTSANVWPKGHPQAFATPKTDTHPLLQPVTTSAPELAVPQVSVVIPTYHRRALLARCLDALTAQTFPSQSYEIIVVDDGRAEDTRTLCEDLAVRSLATGGPVIRYLRPQGTHGPAGARNRGWQAAHGPLIAFTDDDTVPDRDWLREGEAALAPAHRVAVCGHVHVPLPDAMTDQARHTAALEHAVFVTANAFVRREALQRVGGFDDRYERPWREDTDLFFALLAHYPQPDAVAAAPAAQVLHPVHEAGFLVSIGQQAHMAFDALLFKKYPALYDRYVGLRQPPRDDLLIVLSTVLALSLWPLSIGGASAAALLAVALIGRVAVRRLRGLTHSPRQVADMLISSAAIPFASLYWRVVGALRWRVPFY